MTKTAASFTAAIVTLTSAAVSQAPAFRMDPAVQLTSSGTAVTYDLQGTSGTVYAMLANIDGGPADLLGERFYLGLSPTLVTLQAGILPSVGFAGGSLPIPAFAGAVGLAVYGQSAILDANAPNGLFHLTNAESSVIYGSPMALVVDFDNPASFGFTGSYSQQIAGHISGGAVTYRSHRTVDPQSVEYPQGLQNPLNPNGCREQMVFRTQDIGATGDPEVVTAIHWLSSQTVLQDSFQQFELLIGHTHVVPDYTIDPFSALPVAPASGLTPVFGANYVLNDPPQRVFHGRYDLGPAMQRADDYVPLPVTSPFAYDGTSSLLLEFKVSPDAQAIGHNGMFGRLMVQSSPNPNARNLLGGTLANPVNPQQVSTGSGDNWMADLEIQFARVETHALSPWYDSLQSSPDYGTPAIAASLANGTSVQIEYRGRAAAGSTPTAWSSTPDVADGLQELQFRMTFMADLASGEVPVVDTLVVPIN